LGWGFVRGYACVPDGHNKGSEALQKLWSDSLYMPRLYFATATFSENGRPYFPNHSNHYLVGAFSDIEPVMRDLAQYASEHPAFIFVRKDQLFERPSMSRLNFVSVNFIKQECGDDETHDLEDIFLRRRERIRLASFANMQVLPKESSKFAFPHSENLLLLALESEKSHQSDQRYCEKTRIEIIRKGINVDNLVSFSVLSSLK